MNKDILKKFEKLGQRHFWGNYFDSRFYIGYLVSQKSSDKILDIGCGGGILLSLSPAPLKIGLDFSFESLKDAKKLDPTMELIQGDAAYLPFKNNLFSNILAIHILVELKKVGADWKLALNELKRVSAKNAEIIIAGNNKRGRHFIDAPKETRKNYLTFQEQKELFENDFIVNVEGYDPHSKFIMYPLKKILVNFPEKLINFIGLEKILFKVLKSKRYLKNGRSYVMICKKNPE